MKVIIVKIVLFIIPIFVILFYIENRLRTIPNSYSKKKLYFEKHKKTTEVLVLGSSHEMNGVNPQYFSHPGFNLANVSQTSYYDDKMTLKLLDEIPNLKLVLLPLSYFSFHALGHEPWRNYLYYHIWDIPFRDMPIFDTRKYLFLTVYSKDEVVQFLEAGFRVNLSPNYNEFGFVAKDTTDNLKMISDSLGKVRADRYKPIIDTNLPNYTVTDIEELITTLQKRKIQVVLISSPVYKTFSQSCLKEVLHSNDSIINRLSYKYNIPYFNYLYDTNFTNKDFADNDHLNFIGAEKYTKMIDSEIINPIFIKYFNNTK